jgi:hypothetical protein
VNKYLVLYQSPVSAREMMASASPEAAQAGMDAWMAWARRCGDAIVDLGMPLGEGLRIAAASKSAVSSSATGYSIVQADSLEDVAALLEDHPHLQMSSDASIDVLESLPVPGT